ncbi:YcaO-like family protein [Proteinivorax tanatarense]|uniref:YcaO-like family protein n=1 Tax=Proteinivorax tanatarense TaxID=1260629 RepID=A0AAU7VJL2_9FIRM
MMPYFEEMKLKDTVQRLLSYASNKSGLVNDVVISDKYSDEKYLLGDLPTIYCASTRVKSKFCNITGGGVSRSKEISMIRAVGECLERYSAYRSNKLPLYGTVGEMNLKGKCFSPKDLSQFSEKQFNENFLFDKFESNDNLYWEESIDLTNGSKVYLPAYKVYLNYNRKKEKKFYDHSISTGLAFHLNKDEAILSAIHEKIERDCFSISWFAKRPGKKIKYDIDNPHLNELLSICNDKGLKVHSFDIALDIDTYTVMTIIENNNYKFPIIVTAAAAHLDPVKAVVKSIEEAIQTYYLAVYKIITENNGNEFKLEKEQISDLDEHVCYYLNNDKVRAFNFYFNNNEIINLSELRNKANGTLDEQLKKIIESFKENGLPLLVTNLSSKDFVREGFYVYKVNVPNFMDLNVSYNARYLGNERLNTFLKGSKINDNPHPFP